MTVNEKIREARWHLREAATAELHVAAGSAHCAFVCTREGEPVVAAGSAFPEGVAVELHEARGTILQGKLRPLDDEAARHRFFAIANEAGPSLLRRLEIEEVVLPNGARIGAGDWLFAEPGWVEKEQYILDHMNEDHVREMREMCAQLAGVEEAEPRMLAVDPEGMHLRAGGAVHYLRFDETCDTVREVAMQTVMLTHRARELASSDAE
ncbi:MAG: DUF2470 domain-containing protein [Acidobacteriota bacterium]